MSFRFADDSRATQQLALLQSELDTKISDILLLKSDLETKDSILQDQVSICESLRNQLQNAEKSERQIQNQLELLSQQEHRKRIDLEDKIEELNLTCENQKMELSKFTSAAQACKHDVVKIETILQYILKVTNNLNFIWHLLCSCV